MKVRNYVNEEKRTCVVVISDCEYDVIRKVRKTINNQHGEDFGFRGRNSYLNDKYVGKAKCAPEDEFDVETGLEIARDRAFAKYRVAYNREIANLIHTTDEMATTFEELYKE